MNEADGNETASELADRLANKIVDNHVAPALEALQEEIDRERQRANRHLSSLGRLHPLTLLLIRFYNRTHGLPENEEITVSKELLADYGTGGVIIPMPSETSVTYKLVDKPPDDYKDWSLIDEFIKLQAAVAKEDTCADQDTKNS